MPITNEVDLECGKLIRNRVINTEEELDQSRPNRHYKHSPPTYGSENTKYIVGLDIHKYFRPKPFPLGSKDSIQVAEKVAIQKLCDENSLTIQLHLSNKAPRLCLFVGVGIN